MWLTRFDGLFMRLLRLQIGLAVLLVGVFGLLFYAERNRSLAELQAQLWAPALRQLQVDPAAALPPDGPVRLRTEAPPPGLVEPGLWAPRTRVLHDGLLGRGVALLRFGFVGGDGRPVSWVQIRCDDGRRLWLQLDSVLIEAGWPWRLLLALLVAVALLVGASALHARRLLRPLQALGDHMREAEPQALLPDAASTERVSAAVAPAPAEIADIGRAYQELLERLARHERERTLLLAGISHDLRSPLARIRLAAQLLPPTDAVDKRRDTIIRNTDVADRLIGQFLDHVRAAELPLDQSVELTALLRQSHAALARPDSEVRLDLPEAPLVLAGANAVLLERVIGNLLDNALRHGRPPVCLRLTRRSGATGADGGPDLAVITVEDQGEGIAPEQRELALSAFGRGDASRSRPGTGLGLAVVQRVAERLGGRVEMSGPPPWAISVVLPLRPVPEDRATAPPAA